ncbi:MAG: serine/threonine-protein phosphatase [Syntrophus sp. (in: bacteria)]|nr:serine/threonine-protein phosphatase [Syntrophus sp. (in: bacteria)]
MLENVRHCAKSDIGLIRHNNEDSFLIVDPFAHSDGVQRYGALFVVADGMGGHAAGETASRVACEETVSAYCSDDAAFPGRTDDHDTIMQRLEKAIWSAHRKIVKIANENMGMRGMGTTLTALALTDGKAYIAHVGDSRIYRCRDGSCERMTIDHTKKQELIDIGQIGREHENNHYYDYCGHIITQALGGYDDLGAVFTKVDDLRPGDVFLLSTDGLHDHVTDFEIQEILKENALPQTLCDRLVQAAISKGGHDNITVIVIQV